MYFPPVHDPYEGGCIVRLKATSPYKVLAIGSIFEQGRNVVLQGNLIQGILREEKEDLFDFICPRTGQPFDISPLRQEPPMPTHTETGPPVHAGGDPPPHNAGPERTGAPSAGSDPSPSAIPPAPSFPAAGAALEKVAADLGVISAHASEPQGVAAEAQMAQVEIAAALRADETERTTEPAA